MGLNSFHLKIIALVTMTIDHIGYIYFEDVILFRIIGRIAFVLFAFLLAEGYIHTSNKIRYISVIGIFGLVLSIFEYIGESLFYIYVPPNIFLTLFFGLLLIALLDYILKNKFNFNSIIYLIMMVFILYFAGLSVDYGLYGLTIIIMFYLFNRHTFKNNIIKNILLTVTFTLISMFFSYYLFNIYMNPGSQEVLNIVSKIFMSPLQMYGLLALPFIFLYNGKRGYYNIYVKYIIYLYYPLHLVILYYVMLLIS